MYLWISHPFQLVRPMANLVYEDENEDNSNDYDDNEKNVDADADAYAHHRSNEGSNVGTW